MFFSSLFFNVHVNLAHLQFHFIHHVLSSHSHFSWKSFSHNFFRSHIKNDWICHYVSIFTSKTKSQGVVRELLSFSFFCEPHKKIVNKIYQISLIKLANALKYNLKHEKYITWAIWMIINYWLAWRWEFDRFSPTQIGEFDCTYKNIIPRLQHEIYILCTMKALSKLIFNLPKNIYINFHNQRFRAKRFLFFNNLMVL